MYLDNFNIIYDFLNYIMLYIYIYIIFIYKININHDLLLLLLKNNIFYKLNKYLKHSVNNK